MKRNKLTTISALCIAITVTSASALTSIQVQEIKKAVLSVPVPEMPAKASELVTKAEKRDRHATAVTAVRVVAQTHRAATPVVISAVSKAAPELASAVAVAAAEVLNDQAPEIARAAIASAPAQASEVLAAVTKAVPAKASLIAQVAAPVVATRPSASSNPSTGGTVTISDKKASGDNFPLNAPTKAQSPVAIYNQTPN